MGHKLILTMISSRVKFGMEQMSTNALFVDWILFCLFVCLVGFLGLHLWHMEVPRLGVKSELQLPAYATATATRDPSHIFDPHHSSQQSWILNPLNEAREWTCIHMDTSWGCYHWATTGTSDWGILIFKYTSKKALKCIQNTLGTLWNRVEVKT